VLRIQRRGGECLTCCGSAFPLHVAADFAGSNSKSIEYRNYTIRPMVGRCQVICRRCLARA
jgi:hypothetical protein